MTLTSKPVPYKAGFGPFVPEVYRLPYPYLYRSGFSDEERYVDHLLEGVRDFFRTHVDPAGVACLWMELVTGEGGFLVAPRRYVQGLRAICAEHGILFIVDEIQTGFCRTGTLFATEHYGIEPDLVTLAKSLAGGLPLSAVVGRADLLDGVHVGGLGGTYCGNPVACAAALATIDVYQRERVAEHAAGLGERLRARLLGWQARFSPVGDVRGLGPMAAVEFVADRERRQPAPDVLQTVARRCLERGVILIGADALPCSVAHHASALYARNLAALLEHLLDTPPATAGAIALNLEDPIVAGCLFTHAGACLRRDVLGEPADSRLEVVA
jgi:4-aminobutyrate aminotransferase/(S)-3-amino-2-methylpropionate transaminase